MHLSVWVRQRSIPKNTLSEAPANDSHGTPPVDLTGEFKQPAQRKLQIHRARPAVHATAVSPKLAAVISSGTDRELLPMKRSDPRQSCGVCRLARVFTPTGVPLVQGRRRIAGEIVQNSTLYRKRRGVRQSKLVLYPNLWRPTPKIS